MKVYQTDAGLGYMQLAFLVCLEKSENGYNYLCIDTQLIGEDDNMYQIGNIVKDLEGIYVQETNYDITQSPLYNTYLFKFFLENYKLNQ